MMDIEKIYDEQISPLMMRIIEIANAHDMPFLASFQLTGDEDKEGPLLCTSGLFPDGCEPKLEQAATFLTNSAPTATLTITTRDAEDILSAIEHILIEEEEE